MEKVRIVSDGTSRGVFVTMEDGSVLKNISKLSIDVQPQWTIAHIELIVINPKLDLVTPAAIEVKNV